MTHPLKETKLFARIIRFKLKSIALLLFSLFAFFYVTNINAQCDNYDYTLSSNQNNGYTFQSGITRIVGNISIFNSTGATFNDGAIICISNGSTLKISNSASTGNVSFIVEDGELIFNQNPQFKANVNITVSSKGTLTATNTISFNGAKNTIYNEGVLDISQSLQFGSSSINEFDNLGKVNVGGEINAASVGLSHFRNQEEMVITNNFQTSSETTFVNCGKLTSISAFNNKGLFVNTGTFNITSGALSLGTTTATFKNYGVLLVNGDFNLTGEFYNEGSADIKGKIQGGGDVTGPLTSESKTGYIKIGSQSNISGIVGPNLDFSYTFNGTPIQNATIDATVSYNCSGANCANPEDSSETCANLDGTIPCSLTSPGTLIGSCTNNNDLQFTLNLEGSKIGASYTITGTTTTTGFYNTDTVFVITDGADGLDKTITVTDIDDPNCNLTITVSGAASCLDTDGDGVIDIVDLDDDNDGILDTEELACLTNAPYINLGQTFTQASTNTSTSSTTSGSETNLYTFNGVSATFAYQVTNSARWASGVQSQGPTNNVDGNYINAQIKNSSFPNGSFYPENAADLSVVIYTITFTEPVYNLEFKWGGLDNSDRADISANLDGVNVPLSVLNNSLSAGNYTIINQSVVSTTSAANAPNNSVIVSSPNPIKQIVIVGGKEDSTGRVATMQLFELKYCSAPDTDGDGIPNHLDLDSDNDGIPDVIETGGIDANHDGIADGTVGTSLTTNGIPSSANEGNTPTNTDADNSPDYLDIDADNDAIPDNIEAQSTANYIAPSGVGSDIIDINKNGIDDAYETDGIGFVPHNTDNTDKPDYLDSDSDNDGILDIAENGHTANVVSGTDTDKDGLDDAFDDNDDATIAGATVNDGVTPNNTVTNLTSLENSFGDEDNDFNPASPSTGNLDYRD
ncbi:hypothetical protein BTO14_03425, partial [Polaribacter butkevichii]